MVFGLRYLLSLFKCVSENDDEDTIFVYIAALTGAKEHGTSGTKEGEGYWDGDGSRYNEEHELVKIFDFWGTWDTDDAGDYFNYGGIPHIYSAEWDVTDSDPDGLDGAGGSLGEKLP